jgi:uncharacterized protein YyaL (SSP411 family)
MSNRLAHEKSPYLLQHRNNPVDWRPWGKEAFDEAKRLDKPVFLSIGYSTCHWCHVMAHESFENEAIAKILNEYFVPVKVDREERPDVDHVYMTYVQATTGHGGWPMSVWLTPELKPIFGGTYFPPEDRWGRIGFGSLLEKISGLWKTKRPELLEQSEEVFHQILHYASSPAFQEGLPTLDSFEKTNGYFLKSFDPEEGGFSDSSKFPRPVCLQYLSRMAYRKPSGSAQRTKIESMIDLTLEKMARGGMNDQVGGGFHRYSVDALWHVPHYEKMLYDQGQLVMAYLDAFQRSGNLFFAETARKTLDYVRREMRSPKGGFYSAEDADSLLEQGSPEHAEGAFYVWTQEELRDILEKEYPLAELVYGIRHEGNSPAASDPHGELAGKNTLKVFVTPQEAADRLGLSESEVERRLEKIRGILLESRAKRPRPHLDDKIITAWNGLMISGFAKGYAVLKEEEYRRCAERAVAFVLEELTAENGDLMRCYRDGVSPIPGFCEDYAYFIQGLLDLYEATLEVAWLEVAVALQARQDELFWDHHSGGYFGDSGQDPTILIRMKADHDGAEPAANSVSALNLIRMERLTGEKEFERRAEKVLGCFKVTMERSGGSMPLMLAALDAFIHHPLEITFIEGGAVDLTRQREWLHQAHQGFHPDRSMVRMERVECEKIFNARAADLSEKFKGVTGWAAYVCRDQVCQAPVSQWDEFKRLIK